jgi:hypothetical protein
MLRLLEPKNYEQALKPLFTRSIPALIPSIAEVEVLRREAIPGRLVTQLLRERTGRPDYWIGL